MFNPENYIKSLKRKLSLVEEKIEIERDTRKSLRERGEDMRAGIRTAYIAHLQTKQERLVVQILEQKEIEENKKLQKTK